MDEQGEPSVIIDRGDGRTRPLVTNTDWLLLYQPVDLGQPDVYRSDLRSRSFENFDSCCPRSLFVLIYLVCMCACASVRVHMSLEDCGAKAMERVGRAVHVYIYPYLCRYNDDGELVLIDTRQDMFMVRIDDVEFVPPGARGRERVGERERERERGREGES